MQWTRAANQVPQVPTAVVRCTTNGPLGLGMCIRLPWPNGGGNTATHAGVPGGFTQLLTRCPNLWVETPLQPRGNEWALPPGLQKTGNRAIPKPVRIPGPQVGTYLITLTCESSSVRELVPAPPLTSFQLMGLIPPGSGILTLSSPLSPHQCLQIILRIQVAFILSYAQHSESLLLITQASGITIFFTFR